MGGVSVKCDELKKLVWWKIEKSLNTNKWISVMGKTLSVKCDEVKKLSVKCDQDPQLAPSSISE